MSETPETIQKSPVAASAARPASGPAERTAGPLAHLLAAGLAWLFPGLGHLVLGRVHRGLVLAVAITSLYLAGLLIGGVAVVDRRDHPAWFVSQSLIAPSLVLDRYHANVRDAALRANERGHEASGYAPAFGRSQEQGTLYTAAAGLLNLLAILDIVSRRPGHERRLEDRRQETARSGSEPPAVSKPAGAQA